jgi:hypothetical protein
MAYLLRDEFTTDAAAPLASPRTCEPGPGTLTIADADTKMNISGGNLEIVAALSGQGSQKLGWLAFSGSRPVGQVTKLAATVETGMSTLTAGYGSGIAYWPQIIGIVRINASRIDYYEGGANAILSTASAFDVPHEYFFITRSPGGIFAFRANGSSDIKVEWIGTSNTATSAYFTWMSATNGTAGKKQITDYVRSAQLGAPWSDNYGVCDVHATPGVSGTDYAGQANAIIDQAVTAPASLAGEAGVWFRKQDASNGYYAYFDSAGAFRCDRYVAGTPTNVVNVAGVITGSGTRTIRVIADGTALRFYTLSGTAWTQRGSTITPFADSSWTGGGGSVGQLDAWPRTLSGAALAALENAGADYGLMTPNRGIW